MSEKLLDFSARILVALPSASERKIVVTALKEIGFNDTVGVDGIEAALEDLKTNSADWLFVTLEKESDKNCLSLLEACTRVRGLRDMRVSLFVMEDDRAYLPAAFERGLVAWHSHPIVKDKFISEFQDFLGAAAKYVGVSCQMAADYIRKFLADASDFKAMVEFERSYLKQRPNDTKALIELGKALGSVDKKDEARTTFALATRLDPAIEAEVTKVMQTLGITFQTSEQENSSTAAPINVLGVDSCVIAISHNELREKLVTILKSLGVPAVSSFADGKSAAAHVKASPNPGLILFDWKLSDMAGSVFAQRVVHDGAVATPLIVVSDDVGLDDYPIIKEMGISRVISQKSTESDFLKAFVWVFQQDRAPTDIALMEQKIRRLIKAKDLAAAEGLVSKVISSQDLSLTRRKLIEAEWLFAKKDYQAAYEACMYYITREGESILSLNLLGKSLMKIQRFDEALETLERAKTMSPENIERVMNIAETHAETGNTQAAEEAVKEAKTIDEESSEVKEGEVRVAMAEGDVDKAKGLMESMDGVENIVSYMNSKAVALSRCSQFDKSIEQYNNTIQALPANRPDLKSAVHYNLALALAKTNKLEESKAEIAKAVALGGNESLKKKVDSLQTKVVDSIANGTSLELNINPVAIDIPKSEESENSAASEPSTPKIIKLKDSALAGEFGCFLIYTAKEVPERAAEMVKKKIKFEKTVPTKLQTSEVA